MFVFDWRNRLMKLLRGTYGSDAVIRTTKGDQISVKLDGQTAVINLDTLVGGSGDFAQGGEGARPRCLKGLMLTTVIVII